MERQLYAINNNKRQSSVYHRINSVKNIVTDSPTRERIIFRDGEIELSVSGNKLNVSSRIYLAGGESKVTQEYTKIIPNISYLEKTKNNILQRIIDLTIGKNTEMQEIYLAQHFKRNLEKRSPNKSLEKSLTGITPFSKDLSEVVIGGERIAVNL